MAESETNYGLPSDVADAFAALAAYVGYASSEPALACDGAVADCGGDAGAAPAADGGAAAPAPSLGE